jgi:hypothetical protein
MIEIYANHQPIATLVLLPASLIFLLNLELAVNYTNTGGVIKYTI